MKIRLVNTAAGLMPMYDEDWEERRKLKPGEVYVAEIKPARNIRFHRLYFALIEAAWSLLPERTAAGFRTREGFRKYLEVAAGWYEPFYSPIRGEWLEVPKSISFSSMDETLFRQLYEGVKDVIIRILDGYVTRDEFEKTLANF